MDTSRSQLGLLTSLVRDPLQKFGHEMSYDRSLERWGMLFDLPHRYGERATFAQDRD